MKGKGGMHGPKATATKGSKGNKSIGGIKFKKVKTY